MLILSVKLATSSARVTKPYTTFAVIFNKFERQRETQKSSQDALEQNQAENEPCSSLNLAFSTFSYLVFAYVSDKQTMIKMFRLSAETGRKRIQKCFLSREFQQIKRFSRQLVSVQFKRRFHFVLFLFIEHTNKKLERLASLK